MQKQKNFYEILGVGENASADEINSAFKKLAMKYHPDRVQNDDKKKAEYEKKFMEITEAKETLMDPQKRRQYDFTRQAGGGDFGGGFSGFEGFDFGGFSGFEDDFFSMFTGGGGRGRSSKPQQSRVQGADIHAQVTMTLEEAFEGKKINVEYYKNEKCEGCKGSGIKEGAKHKCPQCGGAGYISINAILTIIRQACPSCNGSKYVFEPCGVCNGKCRRKKKVNETVNIPCGVEDGQNIIVSEKGDSGINAPNGNLVIKIKIKDHDIFSREKHDLYVNYEVPLSTMVLGGSIEVSGITGAKFEVKIPAGSQNGARIKVAGQGMKYYNSELRGNLNIILKGIVPNPNTLSKEALEAWKTIQQQGEPTSAPEPMTKSSGRWGWLFF